MTTIGHNSSSLASAAEANVETGIWLLAKEFLVTAIQDRRLERGHLRVLACFAQLMNKTSGKAWPDRATIAAMTGLGVGAVSNCLSELRNLGYLICDREEVPQAGDRRLMVYTFGNIDHETIRREIAKFCERVQRDRSSPPTVKSNSPPAVKFTAHGEESSPPTVKQSSPPAVCSNYSNNNNPSTKKTTVGERGTRLASNWYLPRAWGEWAIEHFVITPDQVRSEAAGFKDYWTGLGNTKNAAKKDWQATWRNWIRNSKRRYRVRKPEMDAAPELTSQANEARDLQAAWEAAKRLTEIPDE
jgi:hypothetical protein